MELKRLATLRKAAPLALFAALAAYPSIGDAAPPDLHAPSLVAPSLGCGAAPSSASLLGRVAAHRQRHQPSRRHRQHRAEARPAPAAEEPVPSLSPAFYTCAATPLIAMPVGTGWLAVGPIRRS